ncbi:hypothetical protein NDN08_008211 [Rhodosorus marinus]|uniref:Membrane insertase YidC/Oxa/ALB C-terminal domain-containing protein n=1 Tax=Rhodosorus marinus TaxID=101924 RepID=A0AAV8V2K5_9RHOD|nr:hypothetical protein NDN08_008211 [Rhodosorus marinus]
MLRCLSLLRRAERGHYGGHLGRPVLSRGFMSGIDCDGDDGDGSGGTPADDTARRIIDIAKRVAEGSTFGEREESFAWWHPMRFVLRSANEYIGLPWWGTILLTTAAMRIIVMPANILGVKFSENMRAVQPQVSALTEKAKAYAQQGMVDEAKKEQQKIQELMGRQGSIMKGILGPLCQMPIFLSMYRSLTYLAENDDSLKTGGVYWLQDLTKSDDLHIAPFLSFATTLGLMEFQRAINPQDTSKTGAVLVKWVGRGFSVMALAFTWKVPAAIFFYWIPNAFFSALINYGLRSSYILPILLREKKQKHDVLKTKISEEKAPDRMGDLDAALSYVPGRQQSVDEVFLTSTRRKVRKPVF